MAEITNKVKKIDRKREIYGRVAFDMLYEYNPPIMTLREISSKLFTKYIMSGKQHWNSVIQSNGFLNAGYGLYKGDVEHEMYAVPITEFKEGISPEDGYPSNVYFSVLEIVEPYDIFFDPSATHISSKLSEYIELGLYPLVADPLSEDRILDSFEKYDEVSPGRNIVGTIIDCGEEKDADLNRHIFVTVMWNPEYVNEVNCELLLSKNGYLHLVDMIKTPADWRDPNENLTTNVGVPVYELTTMRSTLAIINVVDNFVSYMNEAVVTGHLDLDFVRSTLDMATATARQMATEVEKGKSSFIKEHATRTPSSAQDSDDQTHFFVPVEDASMTDDFGHKLHLYDVVSPPDEDDADFDDFHID